MLQWKLDIQRRAKGLVKYDGYNEVSFSIDGSFLYILLLLGLGISFVRTRNLLYRGSSNLGSTIYRSTWRQLIITNNVF